MYTAFIKHINLLMGLKGTQQLLYDFSFNLTNLFTSWTSFSSEQKCIRGFFRDLILGRVSWRLFFRWHLIKFCDKKQCPNLIMACSFILVIWCQLSALWHYIIYLWTHVFWLQSGAPFRVAAPTGQKPPREICNYLQLKYRAIYSIKVIRRAISIFRW